MKSRIELPPNVAMENVHDIFEELIENVSTKRETHQNTTSKQQAANEGTAETMEVNRAANLLQKGTMVCVKKGFFFKTLASLYII